MGNPESSVARVYLSLRQMAIDFEFMPEQRINETQLTKTLNVSRTPLREALNRLVAEGFLTFELGRGFFCRPLSPDKIHELYQLRSALETEAVIRAIETSTDHDIQAVADYLGISEKIYQHCQDINELLCMDEEFHMKLAGLSGNQELLKMLGNINERIRYVRMINLKMIRDDQDRPDNQNESLMKHRDIIDAVLKRDQQGAIKALRNHIERRSEQTIELVRAAYSQLYVPSSEFNR